MRPHVKKEIVRRKKMESLKQQCIYCGDIIEAENIDDLAENVQEHYIKHAPINSEALKELIE
jgi:hypothetical protein